MVGDKSGNPGLVTANVENNISSGDGGNYRSNKDNTKNDAAIAEEVSMNDIDSFFDDDDDDEYDGGLP